MEKWNLYSKGIAAGGGSTVTSAAGGASIDTNSGHNIWEISEPFSIPEVMQYVEGHAHGIVPHHHLFDLEAHTHSVTIPSHTHDIEYGIFQGPSPTAVTVKVDGTTVSGLTATSISNFDLIPFLAKDDQGKILRGQFHEIEITPNNLGRIEATVISQVFVASRGGVDA